METVNNRKQKVNLTQLRRNARSSTEKKSGRKRPRPGDCDVVPAPDAKANSSNDDGSNGGSTMLPQDKSIKLLRLKKSISQDRNVYSSPLSIQPQSKKVCLQLQGNTRNNLIQKKMWTNTHSYLL